MINPFKFRPEDTAEEDPDDWEDNWLSNFMAWFALTVFAAWCSTPTHWTSRFSNYFYTSCPCCLFIRGVVVGIFVTYGVTAVVRFFFL